MPRPSRKKGKAVNYEAKPSVSAPSTRESKPEIDPLENFEIELLWCTQQLEASLLSKKKNPRLAEDSIKNLNTLKSNKAPLIKKRQIMRVLFGDYRAKMVEEEKKFYKANSNVKFSTQPHKEKAQFLKKSSSSTVSEKSKPSDPERSSSENDQKVLTIKKDISDDMNLEERVVEDTKKSEFFTFKPSDNSFRFNFSACAETYNLLY